VASLEIVNIKKRYGDIEVLKGIDIVVEAGEFLVLVGPSGCGKSTLLSMIAGLDSVSEGDIVIGGKRVNDLHPSERDIAMVFQSYALYPNMSVEGNIAFGMEMRKVPKDERERAVQDVAKTLQIDHLLQRRPAQLSGGQRQRVAMGRALVRKPRIFLFDEPLSNLDAQLRVDMRTEIKKLHQRLGATIVYVTHDQIEAMTLATRIAVMRSGELQQLGTPAEIYSRPSNTFVAGFMGSPRMNLLPGLLRSEGDNAWLEIAAEGSPVARLPVGPLPEAVRGYVTREIIAGLRPEAITDNPDANGATRPVVDARVEVTEPTGPDTLAVLEFGGLEVTARLRPDTKLKPGDHGRFAIDLAKMVWFDPGTGARVG
jgi:multiple sugar transport system ATP-binding protein